jgi:hypothetical protein
VLVIGVPLTSKASPPVDAATLVTPFTGALTQEGGASPFDFKS